MNPIIQLNQSLVNKIAAGEVVERPLSVVKELTENAIDAGASVITVEIREGGITMVRVTDNGGGIPAEDLPLAFARHATSKIAGFDDLMRVQTLGFRGEALSSIAAVAQVEMITKTPMQIAGTRVEIHGGKLISSKEIGCADGTTVVVSNLFFNTPARRKFLKKSATEAGYISHCLEQLALGNPSLVLRYINNGQIVFQTTGNGDLRTALLNIYGREIATKTASVDASVQTETGEMRLSGLIGKPEIARGNRRHGSFFINRRYIESRIISRAIESAFKTMLPSGKFPVYALNLTMPAGALDVNVHPTKMDVRFADEEGVFAFLEDVVRDSLEEHNLIPRVRLGIRREVSEEPETEQIALPFGFSSGVKSLELMPIKPPTLSSVGSANSHHHSEQSPESLRLRETRGIAESIPNLIADEFHNNRSGLIETQRIVEPSPRLIQGQSHNDERVPPEPPKPERFFTHYQIHGIVFQTYWLISQNESLYLIDRHAAHERVLYENFMRKAREETVHSQALLTPIPLHLTPRERQTLQDNRLLFASFGFEISNDPEIPEILSVPFLMKGPLPTSFFTELLDKMDETGFAKDSPYTHKTEIIAMAACKAAIKAGDTQTDTEAHELVEQLLELDNPFTCPHGRPTIIEITKNELERRFKR